MTPYKKATNRLLKASEELKATSPALAMRIKALAGEVEMEAVKKKYAEKNPPRISPVDR